MKYLTDNLEALAWGALAGIIAALFGFAWIWRTRDRQLARVGALAQLEASPSLDAEAKAAIGRPTAWQPEKIPDPMSANPLTTY